MKSKTKTHKSKSSSTSKGSASTLRSVLLSVFVTLLVAGAYCVYQMLFQPNINTQGNRYVDLYVYPNQSMQQVCDTLASRQWVRSARLLRWASVLLQKEHTCCGYYQLEPGMGNRAFINRLAYGLSNKVTVKLKMTRYTPWVARNLSHQLLLDSASIADMLLSDSVLQHYQLSKQASLCQFVRCEFQLPWCASVDELQTALDAQYQKFWNSERRALAQKAGLSLAQVHILASIVEEESNRYDEKVMVSGVYLNRLRRGMPLQACPTARYASGDFTLNRILKKHTLINSPYNTYCYAGLPPGPIRIPSEESIDAVLHYTHHNYLFFCASADFSGRHKYSTSLQQHNVYASQYQRELNRRGIGLKKKH